jgi:coenzyme F420-0:L-glutamate ligase/coenzyme F420-1:gamma-L-glutamate ligase
VNLLMRWPDMSAYSVHALIRGRRSIRSYRDREIPLDILHRVLMTAGAAPSAHNRQPWRFVLLAGRSAKRQLADCMGLRLARDRAQDGDTEADIERDVARSQQRIVSAPVVVLVSLTLAEMDSYPDPRRSEAEFQMAVQSTAMSAQNLLLAAHAEGLGACWMCAPLFCPEDVRTLLKLPDHYRPQGLISLGYPADTGKPRGRKPLGEIVTPRPDDSYG